MKIAVHAVGRMKAGPEKELADRYFGRFARAAPGVGLDFRGITEIVESRARDAEQRRREESAALRGFAPEWDMVLLDERGTGAASADMAARLAGWRDSGRRGLVFAIGGPDGHDPALRGEALFALSFGTQTWPHQLVRVMLAEQLYRFATILAGHPYHRE